MVQLLAQTEPESAFLLHPIYPLIFAAVVIGWAWVIEKLDKDAKYFYLPRYWLNLGHLAIGALAMLVMLMIPWFGLGLLLGLGLMIGNVVGYAYYRNGQVPSNERWTLSLQTFLEQFQQRQQARAQRKAKMALCDPKKKQLPIPSGDSELVPVHELAEDILEFALERRAEAVDVAVDTQRAGAFVRVDGVRYPYPHPVDAKLMVGFIDYLKDAAGLDVDDRRKRQTGHLHVAAIRFGEHDLAIETAGSTRGLSLSIAIDPGQRSEMPLEEVGLTDAQLQSVRATIDGALRGVALVAGPKGQGVTTTLYSILQCHDPYTASIVTVEDAKLTDLEGVHHHVLGEGASPDQFNNKLTNLLRGDPHIVMLSHLADEKSAKLAAEASEEMRTYLPLLEENTFAAMRSWVKLVGDRKQAAEVLELVVAQRLVRKLCTHCRVAYKPDAAALKKFNLPGDRVSKLYRASGKVQVKEDQQESCPECHGLAYRGRVGVFEVMDLDDEARKLIAAGDEDQLRTHLRKQKMLWLQEAALQKVLQGVTDIKEITRVLGGEGGGQKKANPAAGQRQASRG